MSARLRSDERDATYSRMHLENTMAKLVHDRMGALRARALQVGLTGEADVVSMPL